MTVECPLKAPRNGVVFVREEEEWDSVIMKPQIAEQESQWGEVRAVGADVEEIEVGDRILVSLYQGTSVVFGNTLYWIVDEDRVLATG